MSKSSQRRSPAPIVHVLGMACSSILSFARNRFRPGGNFSYDALVQRYNSDLGQRPRQPRQPHRPHDREETVRQGPQACGASTTGHRLASRRKPRSGKSWSCTTTVAFSRRAGEIGSVIADHGQIPHDRASLVARRSDADQPAPCHDSLDHRGSSANRNGIDDPVLPESTTKVWSAARQTGGSLGLCAGPI